MKLVVKIHSNCSFSVGHYLIFENISLFDYSPQENAVIFTCDQGSFVVLVNKDVTQQLYPNGGYSQLLDGILQYNGADVPDTVRVVGKVFVLDGVYDDDDDEDYEDNEYEECEFFDDDAVYFKDKKYYYRPDIKGDES